MAHETAVLATAVRSVRPRLVAQAIAGWALFGAVADLACAGDRLRAVSAFDEWEAALAVGELARRSGTGDAQAWRVTELARALLAVPPGDLLRAVDADGLPLAWFESSAVRSATGWNEWDGHTYLSAEAWDEFVDALAERDMLLDLPDASSAAAELRRRAAEGVYRLDPDNGTRGRA